MALFCTSPRTQRNSSNERISGRFFELKKAAKLVALIAEVVEITRGRV